MNMNHVGLMSHVGFGLEAVPNIEELGPSVADGPRRLLRDYCQCQVSIH
jgi:hypothetical protein